MLVRFPLCKLASIATGDAKEELMTALGYEDESMLKTCYTSLKNIIQMLIRTELTQINRIYLNYTEDIDPNFMANSMDQFGVQVEKVGFNYPAAALSYINRWASTATYHRITNLLNAKDINRNTMMVIINAAHYKPLWEFPFDYRLTKLTNFNHIDNKISRVPMMTKADSFVYGSAGDCQLISIKLRVSGVSLTIILPNTVQGLPSLMNTLEGDPYYINKLLKKSVMTPVNVLLPRIKIKTFVDWNGFLQEFGVYKIFNYESSGLSAILKEDARIKSIALSKVKQKLFVQIDELGVSRFINDPAHDFEQIETAIPPSFPEFTADKPFYFQITLDIEDVRHELFAGVYYGPEPDEVNT